jgi:hypothetical protein
MKYLSNFNIHASLKQIKENIGILDFQTFEDAILENIFILPFSSDTNETWERLINAAYRDGRLKGDDYKNKGIQNIATYIANVFDLQTDTSDRKKQEVLDDFYLRIENNKKLISSVMPSKIDGWVFIVPNKNTNKKRHLYAAKIKSTTKKPYFKNNLELDRTIAYLYEDSYYIIGQKETGELYPIKPVITPALLSHIGITITTPGSHMLNLNSKNKTPLWHETGTKNSLENILATMKNEIKYIISKKELILK